MDRKAQGLSMNYIVIAALALIIFIVILVIFSTQTGDTNKGINSAKGCYCKTLVGSDIGGKEVGSTKCTKVAITETGWAEAPLPSSCDGWKDCAILGDTKCYYKQKTTTK